MSILMVTGIEGARNCAAVVSAQLGMDVEVAEGRKAALAALRRREFSAVVVDETMAECDPAAAETIWEHAGLAIPLQINFALSGAARLIREIRAALHRREREQALARRAAAAAIEAELKGTVAGLLLHSQLALNGSEVSSPVAERLRMVAEPGRQSAPAVERAGRGARKYGGLRGFVVSLLAGFPSNFLRCTRIAGAEVATAFFWGAPGESQKPVFAR